MEVPPPCPGAEASTPASDCHPPDRQACSASAAERVGSTTRTMDSHLGEGMGTASASGYTRPPGSRPSSGDEVGRRRFRFVVQERAIRLSPRTRDRGSRVLRRGRHGGCRRAECRRRAARLGRALRLLAGGRPRARRTLSLPGAGRSDPRGPEGVRVSASARRPPRAVRVASRRCGRPPGDAPHACAARPDALAARGARRALLRGRTPMGAEHQRRVARERVDTACVRPCGALALSRPGVAAGPCARPVCLHQVRPLADVRLDARHSETARLDCGDRHRHRRDARRVGGHRVRWADGVSRSRPATLRHPGREQLLTGRHGCHSRVAGRGWSGAHARRRRRATRGLRALHAPEGRGPCLHVRGRRDARPVADRLAPLPRGAARAPRDRPTAVLCDLAAPDPALGQPEARVRRGIPDIRACSRGRDPARRAAREAARAGARSSRRSRDRVGARRSAAPRVVDARRVVRLDRLLRRLAGGRGYHALREHHRGRQCGLRLSSLLSGSGSDSRRALAVSGRGRPADRRVGGVRLSAAAGADRGSADVRFRSQLPDSS